MPARAYDDSRPGLIADSDEERRDGELKYSYTAVGTRSRVLYNGEHIGRIVGGGGGLKSGIGTKEKRKVTRGWKHTYIHIIRAHAHTARVPRYFMHILWGIVLAVGNSRAALTYPRRSLWCVYMYIRVAIYRKSGVRGMQPMPLMVMHNWRGDSENDVNNFANRV